MTLLKKILDSSLPGRRRGVVVGLGVVVVVVVVVGAGNGTYF